MSVVLPLVWYTCRFVSPFRRHTLIHMYTQPHTHAHATHKYMHVYSHTQHHMHTHNTMWMQDGSCSLYFASQEGRDKTVEILLQAGATVDLQDKVESYYSLLWINGVHSNLSNSVVLHAPLKRGFPLIISLPCMLVSILTWLNPWYTSQIMVLTF